MTIDDVSVLGEAKQVDDADWKLFIVVTLLKASKSNTWNGIMLAHGVSWVNKKEGETNCERGVRLERSH